MIDEIPQPPTVGEVKTSRLAAITKPLRYVVGKLAAHKKAVLLCLTVLIGLLLVGGVFQSVRNRNIYAVVEGRAITKQQVASAEKAYKSFYDKTEGLKPFAEKDTAKYAHQQLILDAALQNEAAKYKVTADKAEIEGNLHIWFVGGKAVGGRNGYKSTFGWTDEDVNRYGRITVLETKLNAKLLNYWDILQAKVYWQNTQGRSSQQAEALAKKTMNERVKLLFETKKSAFEIAKVANNFMGKGTPFTPTYVQITRPVVTTTLGLADDQKVALDKLKKVGDTTPVTRSSEGFYYIDRLEGKGEGSFSTYDDFAKNVTSKTRVYKSGFDIRRLWLFSWGQP